MDTNSTSLQADGLQVLRSLVTAVEALTHDTSFKFASEVVEEDSRLRKQIGLQQAEVTRLTEREKQLEAVKEIAYREMSNMNEKEKLKNAEARKEIGMLEAKIQENEQTIAELKKKTAGLEMEVKNAKHIYDEEKKRLLLAKEDITKLQKFIKDQGKLVDELRAGGSKVQRAYENLQMKYRDLETDKSLIEEEIKQKSSRLDELEGYTVEFNNGTDMVLLDKLSDLWEFCSNAMAVHLRKDIPMDRLKEPQAFEKLKMPIIMPHQVPLPPSNTNAAKEMRLAVFMGLLARELADNIFQPLYISPGESDILKILRELAVKDPKKESYCRAILLSMSPEKQNTILKERKQTFLQNVGSYLYDLLPEAQYDKLRQSLEIVVERACETWRFFQYSRNRYEPDFDLLEWGDEEWKTFPFTDSSNHLSQEKGTTGDTDEAVLTIFPRICRLENGEPKPVNFGTVLTKYQCSGADREWRRKEPSSPRAKEAPRCILLQIVDKLEKFLRPAPRPGYQRVTWHSALGKPLYIDVKECCDGGAQKLQDRLRRSSSLTKQTASYTSAPSDQEGYGPHASQQSNSANIYTSGSLFHGPARISHDVSDEPPNAETTDNAMAPPVANQTQRENRYLLLCFTTRKSKSYRQIDITDIVNDQYLFQRVHDEYWEIRSAESWVSRLRFPLRLPSRFHWFCNRMHFFTPRRADFISFTLIPVRRNIYPFGIQPSLPPEEEVRKHNWHYSPCPRVIDHFHMDEAFVTQLLEPGHAFLDDTWLELFPKKLKSTFQYKYQKTGIAWGIHIIEDINFIAVAWLGLLIFLTSGVLGLCYSILAKDVGAGFTIAAWFAGTTGLSIICLQFNLA